jgi:hypothetical protein
LHGKRYHPRAAALKTVSETEREKTREPTSSTDLDVKERTIVNEERDHGTHGLNQLIEANQQATNGARRVFRDVRRRKHGGSSETQAFNKPAVKAYRCQLSILCMRKLFIRRNGRTAPHRNRPNGRRKMPGVVLR